MTRSSTIAWLTVLLSTTAPASCVPEGPATEKSPPAPRRPAPSLPAASPGKLAGDLAEPLLTPFSDSFDRQDLGQGWRPLSPVWRITGGELCGQGARNRGVWLRRKLPVNARIEVDARSDSPDGDIKLEVWGDGRSGATGASYSNATSYILIFGGWKNSKHVLARLDEHGSDRRELDLDPSAADLRVRPVAQGQTYHFKIERTGGSTISWWVDGRLLFELEDDEPLAGPDHDHLAFNSWTVPVCFDNLRITPL